MLKNYLKIALRNIRKNKAFAFIHIIGLTVGLASTFLLLMYVRYEYSYDKWHTKSDRIYRLTHTRIVNGEESYHRAAVFPELGMELQEALPEVISSCRLFNVASEYEPVFVYQHDAETKSFSEDEVFLADSSFFDIFDLKSIHGDLQNALSEPNKMVISASLARKVFHTTDVVGKQLVWEGMPPNINYEIAAVFEDLPENSHLHFQILLSWFKVYGEISLRRWDGFYTYIATTKNTEFNVLKKQVNTFAINYLDEYNASRSLGSVIGLQRLTDIHLNSNLNGELETNGNGGVVKALLIIALAILIIAIFNYINLATSSTTERAKEVGIRKVIGSNGGQLKLQFLLESLCLVFIAHIVAVTMVQFSLPFFNQWMGAAIDTSWWYEPVFYICLMGSVLTITLLAGFYPSVILSSFNPFILLKGAKKKAGKFSIRPILMTFQFTIAMLLSALALLIYAQVDFTEQKSKDFNQNIMVIKSFETVVENQDSAYLSKLSVLRDQLENYESILGATVTSYIPGMDNRWVGQINVSDDVLVSVPRTLVDEDFIDVYGIQLLAGRFFTKADELHPLDQIVVNRKFVNVMGFQDPQKMIGKQLDIFGAQPTIIGITEDFHTSSSQYEIEPAMYTLVHGHKTFLSVAFNQGDYEDAIAAAKREWERTFPGKPFEYFFIDDHIMQQFKADRQLRQALTIFSGLAIFLACLGLLGLSNYNANLRKKELNIRKVLGATSLQLSKLLAQKHLLLVLISALICFPVFFCLADIWLQQYAQKIDLSIQFYLLPFMLVGVITIFTVMSQITKVVNSNPVDHLRSE